MENTNSTDMGIPTGFVDIDNTIVGMLPGQLIIVAGRPGIGKSSFALSVISDVCQNNADVSIFFSLEISKSCLMNRLMTRQGCALQTSYLIINDKPNQSITEIQSFCDNINSHQKIGLVIVDYLSLIPTETKERFTEILNGLKKIGQEISCPVIALSQLKRDVAGFRPDMHSFSEPKTFEQYADIILLLHRERDQSDEQEQTKTKIIIAKNANGNTGIVELSCCNLHGDK